MYQVQFISSGIVAVTLPTRGLAEDWVDRNGFGEDKPLIDPDTGEIVPGQWVKGDCLNLFKVVRVKK